MGPRPIVCDLGRLAGVDVGTLDALARLQLDVRRRGFELRLRRAPEDLVCLLELTGLSEVLRLEPGREAEERKDALRVEEERELDDPAVRDLDHL
jgi:anti-anti-sigma regulatory factor